MNKLREHLIENSLVGRRNSKKVSLSNIIDDVEESMEDIRWNLEVVKKTKGINIDDTKDLSKIIKDLRKLGDKIIKDLKSQEK